MPTHITHGGGIVSPFPSQGQGRGQGTPPPFAQLPIVGVTADSTVWTADTVCVTADGRVICIPAYVAEAAGAVEAFDADVIAGGAVIDADVFEAADAFDQADAISSVSADAVEPANAFDELDADVGGNVVAADVAEVAEALDQLDAAVIAAIEAAPGGAHYPRRRRPLPVYGSGYGILPQLWGEAHGVVGVAGKSAAQVRVCATAVGASGQAGDAAVVLKGLAVVGKGAIGTRGAGSGMIVKFSGIATGRHDDDAAAVIAFLLAA